MATSNNESLENVSSSNTTLDFDKLPFDDFELVCLDVEINDCHNMEDNVQFKCNRLRSFTDVDSYLEYLNSNWFHRIFLIVSDQFASFILPQAEKIDYIISIFIFCKNLVLKDINIISSTKCRGVFNEKHSLITNVMEDIFMKSSFISSKNVFHGGNQREESLLDAKDTRVFIILADVNRAARSNYEDYSILSEKQQMLRECRFFYQHDKPMMKKIEKFVEEYNPTEAIEWYTKDSFLYKIVNQALRTQSTEIIRKFTFFIKTLEESLDLHFAKQTFNQWSSAHLSNNKLDFVYRGQLLSQSDIIRLQSLIGQNIIISQYISTTKTKEVAEMFAGSGERSPQFESVIYKIDMSVIYEHYIDKPDPSIYYYDIGDISQHEYEEEILLRIGTTFKVVSVEKSFDNRWYVMLRFEKVDHYGFKNTINRAPIEIVRSFFNKASQKQNINIENILNEDLSSNTILIMSVFIRLGHLVKHHPREQLEYYQSALSIIPSNQSNLLQVGYWAIRMRCIWSVNDWTSIPLNIYRQTVLHIHGDLKLKLHRELAQIDEARGDFHSAKIHYNELLKCTDEHLERKIIFDELKRLDNKVDELKPVLPPGDVAYWYLYVSILTITERPLIDHYCEKFHQSIDKRNLSEDFSFSDLLTHIDLNEHIQLMNNPSNNIKFDSIDRSVKHIIIMSLTDKPFTLMIEKNLTIGQLKETIRCYFDIPYPEKYDFRLIHLGITLIDEQKSLDHYQINDQSVIYLIHGPRIQHKPINRYEQRLYEGTGLTGNDILRTFTAEQSRLERLVPKQQRDNEKLFNLWQNYLNGTVNADTVSGAFQQFFKENLVSSQYDDDDDADPAHLLDMPDSSADEFIQNSGPRPSMNRLFQLSLCGFPRQTYIEENSNFQRHNQNDDENGINQIEQQTDDNSSVIDQSSYLPNCFPS